MAAEAHWAVGEKTVVVAWVLRPLMEALVACLNVVVALFAQGAEAVVSPFEAA